MPNRVDDPSLGVVDTRTSLVRPGLRTPRAAAIAGIIFSILLICSLWLLWRSVPVDPLEAGSWLHTHSRRVSLALNFVPFAGVAFFWFLGVLRDRLGQREDQFFATVFLGSGLIFLGMLFVAASAMGGLILAYSAASGELPGSATFAFARAFTYNVMQIYALKMAGVFMITTSTLALKTNLTARWIALLGYALAALLLVGSGYLDWVLFIFPAWVLLVSLYILIDNLRESRSATADQRA
ncbi:conserved membrane protein of unknown function [Methylocella tundrae]|uniref:DUF4386 family protein n=1 Tax=Methylocella tundrae TaxID=227605 RepID=A0A4U8Z5V8_METTU|nr:conserved membrane protein of unknown function [Methylocella tundrae]